MHKTRPTIGPRCWPLLVLAFALSAPVTGVAQTSGGIDALRRIQSVDPMSGPPGTMVQIYTENLPVQARVHVGVGAIGSGFEALAEAHQEQWGEVTASVAVPDYTSWEQPVVFIIFNGIFSPIGISDPFHVTNADGLIRRRGEITVEGAGCVTMRDADSFLYSLTGDVDRLEPGDEVVVEGRITETSTCMQGSTLQVVRVVAP